LKAAQGTDAVAVAKIRASIIPLADPQDRELGRLHRRHRDRADKPSVMDVVALHRGGVAAHEERFLSGR
jgi:hypothetical protein